METHIITIGIGRSSVSSPTTAEVSEQSNGDREGRLIMTSKLEYLKKYESAGGISFICVWIVVPVEAALHSQFV